MEVAKKNKNELQKKGHTFFAASRGAHEDGLGAEDARTDTTTSRRVRAADEGVVRARERDIVCWFLRGRRVENESVNAETFFFFSFELCGGVFVLFFHKKKEKPLSFSLSVTLSCSLSLSQSASLFLIDS